MQRELKGEKHLVDESTSRGGGDCGVRGYMSVHIVG